MKKCLKYVSIIKYDRPHVTITLFRTTILTYLFINNTLNISYKSVNLFTNLLSETVVLL